MIDPSEVQLEKTPAPAATSPLHRSPTPWLLAALALLVGIAAIWFFFGPEEQEPVAEPVTEITPPAPPVIVRTPGAICEVTDPIDLPPLDESDDLAGTLASSLSAHPRVVAWLASDQIIRRFVVVVDIIASGRSPAAQLRALRPSGTFRAIDKGEGLFIDPRSYERYTAVADAVDSVDVQAAARLCSALKPRFDDAYDELGGVGSFDVALERAIVALLQTPAVGADARLVPQGAVYGFEDPALENLTPAQKHLARMGPRHARVIQDKLRQIAMAIGIPRERLPS